MYLSRDPFARNELHRRTITSNAKGFEKLYECDWCGNVRRTKNGRPTAYRYETRSDGGRVNEHKGTFCCKGCHDAYHM